MRITMTMGCLCCCNCHLQRSNRRWWCLYKYRGLGVTVTTMTGIKREGASPLRLAGRGEDGSSVAAASACVSDGAPSGR